MGSKHLLLLTWFGWLVTASGRQIYDILKANLQESLQIRLKLELSITVDVSFWVGYLITALLLGILSDRIGRKKIIYLSLLLYSIPTALIYFSTEQTFILIRFCQGLSVGGFFPVAVALLGDSFSVETRAKVVSRFVSGGIFGSIIAWMIGSFANDILHSIQLGFLMIVPPIILVAIFNYFFLEESPVVSDNPPLLKTIENGNKNQSESIFQLIKIFLNNRFLIIVLLFCALDLFTLWLIDDWIPYYVIRQFNIPADQTIKVAIFRGFSAGTGILGILFFGYFADKFGRKKALITAVSGGIISTILFLITALNLSFEYMYPLSAAIGFFSLGEFAAIYVLVMENAPANHYGMAMGFCIFIGNAIAMTGGPIAALLADNTILGLQAFLIVPIIALCLRLPLSLLAKDPAFIGFGMKKR